MRGIDWQGLTFTREQRMNDFYELMYASDVKVRACVRACVCVCACVCVRVSLPVCLCVCVCTLGLLLPCVCRVAQAAPPFDAARPRVRAQALGPDLKNISRVFWMSQHEIGDIATRPGGDDAAAGGGEISSHGLVLVPAGDRALPPPPPPASSSSAASQAEGEEGLDGDDGGAPAASPWAAGSVASGRVSAGSGRWDDAAAAAAASGGHGGGGGGRPASRDGSMSTTSGAAPIAVAAVDVRRNRRVRVLQVVDHSLPASPPVTAGVRTHRGSVT